MAHADRVRRMTIVAQDPGVSDTRQKLADPEGPESVLTATVDVPAEDLAPGPRGHRVYVVDYDSTNDTFYEPFDYEDYVDKNGELPFKDYTLEEIRNDANFHAMNVYAIVMRTLARFEFGLGRRVPWNMVGHQLKVLPHGFADANAFYAEDGEALVFGYFKGSNDNTIYSCLSHDVIVHETTHAVLDGLRGHYTAPSSSDQAAFHEGFADIVALLSVLSLPDVIKAVIDYDLDKPRSDEEKEEREPTIKGMVHRKYLTPEALRESVLLGLATEMGTELGTARGTALRRSAELEPSKKLLDDPLYQAPHRRGEILSAAVLQAFLRVWCRRIALLRQDGDLYSRSAIAAEGAEAADYLLTMVIRALDFTPPVHLTFADFLAAVLTADNEVRSNDSKYKFRFHLRESFDAFGIGAAPGTDKENWMWKEWTEMAGGPQLFYGRTRFESMQESPDEVFRWVWDNRRALGMADAYTEITSVRRSTRTAPVDGFPVHETVVEATQRIEATVAELEEIFGIKPPPGMAGRNVVELMGGATLIFDEYGRLKFVIPNLLPDSAVEEAIREGREVVDEDREKRHMRGKELYKKRLQSMSDHDAFVPDRRAAGDRVRLVPSEGSQRLAELHLNKAIDFASFEQEAW